MLYLLIAGCSNLVPSTDRRQLWNRIDNTVILGAAPFLESEVRQLYEKENVRAVVNMCREWNWHAGLYASLGIEQLHVPTVSSPRLDCGVALVAEECRCGVQIDYDIPTLEACAAAVKFIRKYELR
jgi:hypothetical protein